MARSQPRPTVKSGPSLSGEIWTDARGRATVVLPTSGQELGRRLECELELLAGSGEARLVSDVAHGSLVIQTDEPHVKVAWRITAEREAPR